MFRRIVAPLLVAAGLIGLFSWPLGAVGITFFRHTQRAETKLSLLAGRWVFRHSAFAAPVPAIGPDRYGVRTEGAGADGGAGAPSNLVGRWPRWIIHDGSTVFAVAVPVPFLLGAVSAPLLWAHLVPVLRTRRRRRRSRCVGCGYDLRESPDRCPECGATPAAAHAQTRWPYSLIPSLSCMSAVLARTCIAMSFLLGLMSTAAWSLASAGRRAVERDRLRTMDITYYIRQASPRLTGRVISVGTDGQFPDLQSAVGAIAPGTLVLVGPGDYELPARTGLDDVAIVGSGPEQTRLRFQLDRARRVRIENATIDCANSECLDLRMGGAAVLRRCALGNYNSGAGGSNAVGLYGGGLLLVTDCSFDGEAGRASRSSRGNAFDLRGDCRLYVRNSVFTENAEIVRSCPATFDRCHDESAFRFRFGVSVRARPVYARESDGLFPRGGAVTAFQLATDEPAFIDAVLSESPSVDAQSKRLIDELGLSHHLPYWVALLRNEDESIRRTAARRVAELTGKPVALEPGTPADSADDVVSAYVEYGGGPDGNYLMRVLSHPDARPLLDALRTTGNPTERTLATMALRLMELDVPLSAELAYSDCMAELDKP